MEQLNFPSFRVRPVRQADFDLPSYEVQALGVNGWRPVTFFANRSHLAFWADHIARDFPRDVREGIDALPEMPSAADCVASVDRPPPSARSMLRTNRLSGVSGAEPVPRSGSYSSILAGERRSSFFLASDDYHGVLAVGSDASGNAVRLAVSPNGLRYHVQRRGPDGWAGSGRKWLKRWLPDVAGFFDPAALAGLPDSPEDCPRSWADETAAQAKFLRSANPQLDAYPRVLVQHHDWRLSVCPLGLEYLLQRQTPQGWRVCRRGPARAVIAAGVVADVAVSGWPAVGGWSIESAKISEALATVPESPLSFGPMTRQKSASDAL